MKNSTVLILVGKSSNPDAISGILGQAADLATHVSILVVDVLPPIPTYSYGIGLYGTFSVPEQWQEIVERNREELSKATDAFGALITQAKVEADIESMSAERGALEDRISLRALSADFVVVANDIREDKELFEAVLQSAIFGSSAGVVLNAGDAGTCLAPKRVFVAWNYGLPVSRAVRAALPMLCAAEEVTLAIFDPLLNQYGDGENPGSDVARWLTHHGCTVTVKQLPAGGQEISEAIAERATEAGADLVIMGAYDHSRMRQTLFGGTTRHMIEQTGLCVLLAH